MRLSVLRREQPNPRRGEGAERPLSRPPVIDSPHPASTLVSCDEASRSRHEVSTSQSGAAKPGVRYLAAYGAHTEARLRKLLTTDHVYLDVGDDIAFRGDRQVLDSVRGEMTDVAGADHVERQLGRECLAAVRNNDVRDL